MNDWPCVEPVISFSEHGTQNCSTELLRPTGESTQMCWRAFFFLIIIIVVIKIVIGWNS